MAQFVSFTSDDRLAAIQRVKELGKPAKIEDVYVSVDAANKFCYLYDKLSEPARARLKSYSTAKGIWLAVATMEGRK